MARARHTADCACDHRQFSAAVLGVGVGPRACPQKDGRFARGPTADAVPVDGPAGRSGVSGIGRLEQGRTDSASARSCYRARVQGGRQGGGADDAEGLVIMCASSRRASDTTLQRPGGWSGDASEVHCAWGSSRSGSRVSATAAARSIRSWSTPQIRRQLAAIAWASARLTWSLSARLLITVSAC